jgi:hypothetical protein
MTFSFPPIMRPSSISQPNSSITPIFCLWVALRWLSQKTPTLFVSFSRQSKSLAFSAATPLQHIIQNPITSLPDPFQRSEATKSGKREVMCFLILGWMIKDLLQFQRQFNREHQSTNWLAQPIPDESVQFPRFRTVPTSQFTRVFRVFHSLSMIHPGILHHRFSTVFELRGVRGQVRWCVS